MIPADASLHPVAISDLQSIAEFCSAFPNDGRSIEFWEARLKHWWVINPAASSGGCLGTRLMANGKIVGTSLAIPLLAHVHGEPRTIFTRSTWRVMPEHRGMSLATEAFNNNLLFDHHNIASTPLAVTRPLLAMWGWQPLRDGMKFTSIAANPISIVMRFLKRRLPIRPLASRVSDGSESALYASADAVWAATSGDCEYGPVRNAAYFRWFSADNPTMPFTVFAQGEALSQTVFALATHYADGVLHVTDFWPWNAPATSLRKLIKRILHTARAHRFHSIRIPHLSPEIAAACDGMLASQQRTEAQHILVHFPSNDPPGKSNCWPLNSGDVGI